MRRVMVEFGHHATFVEDGGGAVAALASEQFDIAMLDQHMPLLTGTQVIEWVRTQLPPSQWPVLAIATTDQSPQSRVRALAAGADYYLVKPLTASDLNTLFA